MCDTFVACGPWTADGSILLGKNSDREPNEPQALEYVPAASHGRGERVRCTHVEIPQAPHTRAVLLCRPAWMWGAEMGANEKGLAIGNEAVWTRMPLRKEGGLTGMDLVRLGLERADGAEGAVEVITSLLSEHGQGGNCGFGDRFYYHASFILADPGEAWVLETAGPLWAARRVPDSWAISNVLSIGEEFDLAHPDLIPTARKQGWIRKGQAFHFSRVLSDRFYTFFSRSRRRRARTLELLEQNRGRLDVAASLTLLRDHGGAPGYRPDSHLTFDHLCGHAADPVLRHAVQTTGSLVAHLAPRAATLWATGTSAPCLSVFKPLRFEGPVLPDLGPEPGRVYEPSSLWWSHEKLHRTVLRDFEARAGRVAQTTADLERSFMDASAHAPAGGHFEVTREAFARARAAGEARLAEFRLEAPRHSPRLAYRWYWSRQNRKAGLIL